MWRWTQNQGIVPGGGRPLGGFGGLLLAWALLLLAAPASAQPTLRAESGAALDLQLEVGETRLVHLSERAVRISVADPEVADVRVVTPTQVLVSSKTVGRTHLIVWNEQDKPVVVGVDSRRNLSDLRQQIGELFPGEPIKVSASGDLVVLSGTVNDLRVPGRVAEVARLHTERLANLVEVSGNQQIQLEVRFAEVSRTGLRKMGINFLWRDTDRGYVSALSSPGATAGTYLQKPGELHIPGTGVNSGPPVSPTPLSGDAFSLIFSTGLSAFPFSALLNVLKQEGLAKVLAEPTLVAMSGQEASFHAGGEVPVLIAQQLGQVSVSYKKFGVQLKFVPVVLGHRTISLKIFSEVSEPDPNVGVVLGGYTVPGFKTRNSETTVRLKDGQSFAIAGLLSDTVRSAVKKVPLLGEIPILGSLFRSNSFQREESELMVVVRAVLVEPVNPEDLPPMPGEDEVNDPGDFSFFLLGSLDTSKRERKSRGQKNGSDRSTTATPAEGGPAGPVGFGHD